MTHPLLDEAGLGRRGFLATIGIMAAGGGRAGSLDGPWPQSTTAVRDEFPRQDPKLVAEIVGASHRDPATVRRLIQSRPSLANVAWDWGFGDWETPLGAASHVGNREIAELLLQNGAMPTLFSAVMLGDSDTVRTVLDRAPQLRTLRGPHGITLLAHARAGGSGAAEVKAYLEQFPDTDRPIPNLPLDATKRDGIVGTYRFGESDADQLTVAMNGERLTIARPQHSRQNLLHQGSLRFHPPGVTNVWISFTTADDGTTMLEIRDPDLVLSAPRTRS